MKHADPIALRLPLAHVGSVNAWLTRHGVEPAGREVSGQGHAKNLYRPSDVRTAKKASPGSGNYKR